MKSKMIGFIVGVAALAIQAFAVPSEAFLAYAQAPSPSSSPLLLPPQVEKELAARAANVTEVTLNKDMLGFASKFMDGKDKDQAAANQLIQGLDGIYVRDYEFDKEGQYSIEDVERLRRTIETPEWTPLVHNREHNGAEISDVMVKMVNGGTKGMLILSVEPKELSIVLILGNIRMDRLSELKGIGGLSALGNVDKNTKNTDKDKAKDKGGDQ